MESREVITLGVCNTELDLLKAAHLRRPIGDPLGEIIGSICDAITETDHDRIADAWSEIENKAADLSRAARRTACALEPVHLKEFPVGWGR